MKEIRVQIEGVDDEGRGRGFFSDATGHDFDVAVRGAFIGDDVMVEVERVFAAHQLIVGRAIQFFERGNCHTARVCPHDGPCPACPLHGIDHSLASEIKLGRIERALDDANLNADIDDLVNHPHQYGYRQKVKLMAEVVDGHLRLGVYVPYSHHFVVAEQCPYVNPSINQAISSLLALLNRCEKTELTRIKAIILRAGRENPPTPFSKGGNVAAVIVTTRALSDAVMDVFHQSIQDGILLCVVERVQSKETNSILSGEINRQLGPRLIEALEGGPLVDPDSFCQSDPEQATFMYDLVAAFLTKDSTNGLFLDAYAGVGGFTRALLRSGVEHIIAVEQSPSALSALTQLGVQVILEPMSRALAILAEQQPFAGIVVDPPKKGLVEDASAIAKLGAKRVALVSCDPDAMARDLSVFLEHGYTLERIVPIDFFGGTPAIESVVLLILGDATEARQLA